MATVLTSGSEEIAAGDTVRLYCDFGDCRQLIEGATIASYTVTCTGSGTPPTVSGAQLDYSYRVSAKFTATTAGQFSAVYTVTLSDLDQTVIKRTGNLVVK